MKFMQYVNKEELTMGGITIQAQEPTGEKRKLIWIRKGKNIYNSATDIEFKNSYSDYLSQGKPIPLANYDIIKLQVKPNTNYIVSTDIHVNVYHNLCFYDENMTFIAGYPWEVKYQTHKTFTTPANCKYVRFTAKSTRTWMLVEEGDVLSEFEEYVDPGIFIKNKNDEYVSIDRYTDF